MANRTIVVLGDDDIRSQVRESLKGERDVDIIAEFSAFQPRHVDYIDDMAPDVVVLDCASRTINPLAALTQLSKSIARPQVVAVIADGGSVDFRAISRMNPASFVNTPSGLRTAVLDPHPTSPSPIHGVAA